MKKSTLVLEFVVLQAQRSNLTWQEGGKYHTN
jgi:hypothetical protein